MATDVGRLAQWCGPARDEFEVRRRQWLVDAQELVSALRHTALRIERAGWLARLAEADLASSAAGQAPMAW